MASSHLEIHIRILAIHNSLKQLLRVGTRTRISQDSLSLYLSILIPCLHLPSSVPSGSRLILEEVLSHDCCPSLRAVFSKAGSSFASILVPSLQRWLDAHSSSGSGGGSSAGTGSGNKRPLQRRPIKLLRRCGLVGTSSAGGTETASVGNCGDSCSSKEPQTTSPVKLPKVCYRVVWHTHTHTLVCY